mgnify:CR=1 FL=1|jgi:hypothetical protein
MNILLNKENPDLPDFYKIEVHYYQGSKDEFEAVSHSLLKETRTLELVTKDDLWHLIPLATVKRISFDRNFSKIVELKKSKKV